MWYCEVTVGDATVSGHHTEVSKLLAQILASRERIAQAQAQAQAHAASLAAVTSR
jgi:hypothetical protein